MLLFVRTWGISRWVVAAAATMLAALLTGIPTGVVASSFYTRMTAVTWWDYPIWVASAILVGLTAATYVRAGGATPTSTTGRTLLGGLFSAFAIGCPICNKLVVALIGVTGALNYWAPLQPALGVLSVAVLALGLRIRLRGMVECRLPAPA